MSQSQSYKRWYDRQPKLSQAFKLIIILPDEVRSIISESLILLANREFDLDDANQSFRTLGSEKILGVHKSKGKRRNYDQNKLLHKAMNYLYILSDANQDFMAQHILKMVEYIQTYLATCREFKSEPTLEDVAVIANLYVEKGTPDVHRFLKQLREEFYLKLALPEQGVKRPIMDILADLDEPHVHNVATQGNAMGLKVKKSDFP